jgi:hypothetical protein
MFAMVLLTFFVLVRLFRTRSRFVSEGRADPTYFKTYQSGSEPEESAKLSRHFSNLFESPVLFYVACLAAMQTGQSGRFLLVLAWIYVLLRVAHAYIHTGRNKLQPRIAAYFGSWIVLLAIWIRIVVGLGSSEAI